MQRWEEVGANIGLVLGGNGDYWFVRVEAQLGVQLSVFAVLPVGVDVVLQLDCSDEAGFGRKFAGDIEEGRAVEGPLLRLEG